jgi:hypothetical protein
VTLRALIAAVLALLALVPAAHAQGDVVDRAIQALKSDPVYVDPGADHAISSADAARLRSAISDEHAAPMYIAILPGGALGGSPYRDLVVRIHDGVGRPGTYAVVAGDHFGALSDDPKVPRGSASDQATKAFEKGGGGDDDVMPTLLDFIDRMGTVRSGGNPDARSAAALAIIPIVLILVGGVGLLVVRKRRRRQRREQMDELRENVRDDLVALGDDIRALDIDVELDSTDPKVKSDYAAAVDAYDRADRMLATAETPGDMAPIASALEEGRYNLAAAKARQAGEPVPERRPPCFFNPRHGPSTRDVEWSPAGGAPRMVPACEADAIEVEEGRDPESRHVLVGGRPTPYWAAGPQYAPMMGGYFGDGLLPGLLIGSALSGWGSDTVYVDQGGSGWNGGDFGGGGGDFGGGGGDFGGGGGDFGGGDFGGGGGDF